MNSIDLNEYFIEVYKNVASLAAEYELRLRLLANCTKELKEYKSEKLHELEAKFIEHFSFVITDNQKVDLKKYRKIRNKLLHIEFKEMLDIILELNHSQTYNSNVRELKFRPNESILDQITRGIKEAPSISNLKSYDSFSWLMNCCTNGVMAAVKESMLEAIKIVNNCHDYKIKQDLNKD